MSNVITLRATVRVSWWVRPLIHCLVLGAWVTGCNPGKARVDRWIRKGIKVEIA